MSSVLATTKLAAYREVGQSPLGDEVDDNTTPVEGLESFGASLIEKTKRVEDPSTGTWRSIPYLKARLVNPTLDVRMGDRVRDLSTGKLMTVDSIRKVSRSLAGAASLTLDLTDRAG